VKKQAILRKDHRSALLMYGIRTQRAASAVLFVEDIRMHKHDVEE
jgi:hypothetical protein